MISILTTTGSLLWLCSVWQVNGGLVNLGTQCVQQACATTSSSKTSAFTTSQEVVTSTLYISTTILYDSEALASSSTSSGSSSLVLYSPTTSSPANLEISKSSTENLFTPLAQSTLASQLSAQVPSQITIISTSQYQYTDTTHLNSSIYSGLATSTSMSLPAIISSAVLDVPTTIPTIIHIANFSTILHFNTSTITSSDPQTTAGMILTSSQFSNTTSSTLSISSLSETTSTSSRDNSTSYSTFLATNITTFTATSSPLSVYLNSTSIGWSNTSVTTGLYSSPLGCTILSPGEAWTTYRIMKNTTTTWGTIIVGISTTFTATPEFTPPVRCTLTTAASTISSSASTTNSAKNAVTPTTKTVTAIITSKNGVTILTTITPADYIGGTEKVTATITTPGGGKVGISIPPVSTTPKVTVAIPLATTPDAVQAIYISTSTEEAQKVPTTEVAQAVPTTEAVQAPQTYPASTVTSVAPDGITVILSPTNIVVGDQSFAIPVGSSTSTITAIQSGSSIVYTLDASKVVGPSLTIDVSITKVAQVVAPQPTASTAPKASAQATNLVILDPEPFSIIGSSIVVLGSSTITYGPTITYASGALSTTSIIHGEIITVGPQGVSYDGTTVGGALNPTGTKIGLVGGLSVTEVGSTLAIINGVFFTIGPSASAFTTVINGHTITADSTGLVLGGTTLTDFNPSTVAITVGSVTFSAIGSTLAVIGGKTYTYGTNAVHTTAVVNGKTISIGPGGIGFASTTFMSYAPTALPAMTAQTSGGSSSFASKTASGSSDSSVSTGSAASPSTTGKQNSGERIGPVVGMVLLAVVCVACMI